MLSARSSAGWFHLEILADDQIMGRAMIHLQVTIQPVLWSEDPPVLTRRELVDRSG